MGLSRALRTGVGLSLARAWVGCRSLPLRLAERRHLADFRRFYNELPDRRGVFYVFFSGGLLHWLRTLLAFLPERINLALIGSDLTPAELEWLRTCQPRPFHHIPLRVDDKTVWELLFATNRHNFGWLDVDCFVLEPRVLDELAAMDPEASLGSAFSYVGHGGERVVSTHLVFVNTAVRDAIERSGVAISPCTYAYRDNPAGRHVPYATTRVPTRRQIELLREELPVDDAGLPIPPSMIAEKFFAPVFDTLVLYQFVARTLGHPVQFVRRVSGIAGTPESYSNELMHIAAASYFRTLKRYESYKPERLSDRDREQIFAYYKLLLQFNFLLLSRRLDGLPEEYRTLHRELRDELDRLGIPVEGIAPSLRGFLVGTGSVDEAVFEHPGWRDLWE